MGDVRDAGRAQTGEDSERCMEIIVRPWGGRLGASLGRDAAPGLRSAACCGRWAGYATIANGLAESDWNLYASLRRGSEWSCGRELASRRGSSRISVHWGRGRGEEGRETFAAGGERCRDKTNARSGRADRQEDAGKEWFWEERARRQWSWRWQVAGAAMCPACVVTSAPVLWRIYCLYMDDSEWMTALERGMYHELAVAPPPLLATASRRDAVTRCPGCPAGVEGWRHGHLSGNGGP